MSINSKFILATLSMIFFIVTLFTYSDIKDQEILLNEELDKRVKLMKDNLKQNASYTIQYYKNEVENDLASMNLSHINQLFEQLVKREDIDGVSLINIGSTMQMFAGHSYKKEVQELSLEETDKNIIISSPIILSSQWGTLNIVYSLKKLNDEVDNAKKDIAQKIAKNINNAIVSSILFGFLFGVLSYILSKKLTNPILLLTNTAKKIAQGDLKENSELSKITSKDEIGVLASTFKQMTEELDTSYDKLKNLNENLEKKVEERTVQLSSLNDQLTSSIEYASLIQSSLIPKEQKLNDYFKDSFCLWSPRDIVGGDIYLFEELRDEDESLLMVIDCTGHGVPGAFVTMLVKALEREVVAKIKKSDFDVNPAIILEYFNKTMRKLLGQDKEDAMSNAGFDGSIIYINKKTKQLKFAGAYNDLYHMKNGELHLIKGNKHSIGYKKSDPEYKFTQHILNLKEDEQFYITTDGYIDQKGGEKGFCFGKKRFKKIIEENHKKQMSVQKDIFIKELNSYQGDHFKIDDITLIGLEV